MRRTNSATCAPGLSEQLKSGVVNVASSATSSRQMPPGGGGGAEGGAVDAGSEEGGATDAGGADVTDGVVVEGATRRSGSAPVETRATAETTSASSSGRRAQGRERFTVGGQEDKPRSRSVPGR